ncbi:MAG: phosphate butyryltransferase [Deltaproteobacteria bacterium]|nr:phosphate butyryltransferase [Deltaproteobacteria bacterium]
MRILDRADDLEAAGAAINEVKEGRGDIILKGNVKSHTLLKEILKKENGLKRGLLSDCLVTEDPASNRGRLIGVTDGGVNIEPSLAEKIEIVRNAIFVFQRLGFFKPLVAALSAVETPVDSMRSSTDAAELKRLNLSGVIKDCVVEGPLALDNAISVGAAAQKGVASEVAGRADILLVPNIESGNLLGKSLFWFSRCPLAHVIIGARVPVLIPSRTEDCESKSYSIALGVLCA